MALTRKEIDERYRNKDIEAYRKHKAEYARTPEQRAVRAEYMRKWRAKNVEKNRAAVKDYRKRNPEKVALSMRKSHYLRLYGMTQEMFSEMVLAQNGKCAICNDDFKSQRLTHVDHCHKTGKVRKLLCSRCNGALGWYEKYTKQIQEYL